MNRQSLLGSHPRIVGIALVFLLALACISGPGRDDQPSAVRCEDDIDRAEGGRQVQRVVLRQLIDRGAWGPGAPSSAGRTPPHPGPGFGPSCSPSSVRESWAFSLLNVSAVICFSSNS